MNFENQNNTQNPKDLDLENNSVGNPTSTKLNYKKAQFTTSAPTLKNCPPNAEKEVAFVGRSNAGKSSALNALTGSSKLAKTSKTPGRTQLINFFLIENNRYLVDLPGYGYAKVSQTIKLNWQKNLDEYLSNRHSLSGIVLMVDSRHPLKPFDQMMVNWSTDINIPLHILLTKSDKLRSGARKAALKEAQKLIQANDNVSIQLFSSTHKLGLLELTNKLNHWLY